jgi:hypothetical protein
MHLGTALFSGAMATDVTTGAAVTWNGWGNGGFGLGEVSPGERVAAAGLMFLPIGRGGSVVDDVARAGLRAERSFAGAAVRPWGVVTGTPSTSTALAKYWPGNSGFVGQIERTHLMPGTLVDRYGYPGGKFVSPAGTSFGARALPADYLTTKPFHAYEVMKPIEVNTGSIMPWFSQHGMGVQHELPVSLEILLKCGFLREVGP